MPGLIEVPEQFVTLETNNELGDEYAFWGYIDGNGQTYEDAAREILAVLRVMGDYSLTKLLEVIEDGRVDGDRYSRHLPYGIDYYEEEAHRYESAFVGCLLGWAGFLEHLKIDSIYSKAAVVLGLPPSEDYSRDEVALAAEEFIGYIHEGDSVLDNPFLARFKELVEFEIARRAAEKELVENA